ncbi:MAG: FAD-dependent oxidoreductase [Bacteroidia bacterium]|nr:FAD-dependent oxidoreductase [Bacteroidia bacterium]
MKPPKRIIIIGSGIGGLTAGCLLSHWGFHVIVVEQNWLPGGCSSSYPRKKFVFDTGATTLVGITKGMPLNFLFQTIGVNIQPRRLKIPMKVHFSPKKILTRHENLPDWIAEAERFFGKKGQSAFWNECFSVAQNVWSTSTEQRTFPPTRLSDWGPLMKGASLKQVAMLPRSFLSTQKLLEKHGLDQNPTFVDFVNEQLMITAQNTAEEVNQLFGATALCYTNFGNYYLDGGMYNLVKPLVEYIENQGGSVLLRHEVDGIRKELGGYVVSTKKQGEFRSDLLVSGIPLNNTLALFEPQEAQKLRGTELPSEKLVSAFQMGIAFKKSGEYDCLHHQIHLEEPLPVIGSKSIFLSLSHPEDRTRCGPDEAIASVSTHIPHPEATFIEDKSELENKVLDTLEKHGFLRREDILFMHSSTPKSWKKWTGREWGFVGGYPQYLATKPWQMNDARLDGEGAYLCGDSAYPGQGIPGACLSGIIAAEKLMRDWR